MLKITGTFLDEISWDIPHHNWGRKEWERDFQSMKAIGIDTVIMIRCGLRQFITYPSAVLMEKENCLMPYSDLPEMFLDLAEKYGMAFYFGTYDAARPIEKVNFQYELDLNKMVIEEAWQRYGRRKAFKGWYLSTEISHKTGNVAETYAALGSFCKEVSGNLPVLISPFIQGVKAYADQGIVSDSIPLEQHEKEWDEIFACIQHSVDHIAFQDGHVDLRELQDYLKINMKLAGKYGIDCWTNCETFDRDMPIRFLPVKWEKMWHKLRAAEAAGIQKAVTFEFSHFMSPNSAYPQAHGLYDRYREYAGLLKETD